MYSLQDTFKEHKKWCVGNMSEQTLSSRLPVSLKHLDNGVSQGWILSPTPLNVKNSCRRCVVRRRLLMTGVVV